MTLLLRCIVTTALAFTFACDPAGDAGDDDDGGEGEGEGEGEEGEGEEGEGEGGDPRCADGCVLTIAAACENGPPSAEVCETDCNELLVGACATEFQEYIECGDGAGVTCDAGGFPSIASCPDQETAFRACVSG